MDILIIVLSFNFGVFLMLMPKKLEKASQLPSRLMDVKYKYNENYAPAILNGVKGFKGVRFFMAKNLNLDLSRLKKNLEISGLIKHLNEYDVVFFKTIIALFLLIALGLKYMLSDVSMSFVLMWLILFFIALMWDRIVIPIYDAMRIKAVYDQFGYFINIFSSCVVSGDNVYRALRNTEPHLSGDFRMQVKKCLNNFRTLGREEALTLFKKDVNVDVIDYLVAVINENDNDGLGLYSYLNSNLSDFLIQKSRLMMKENERKKSMYTFASALGFSSILVIISSMLLGVIKLMDKLF